MHLIGRTREMSRLHRCLDEAWAGQATLVLIGGEAGIGKTTLAEAGLAAARASGAITAVGRCYERGVAPPFAPWPDLLAALAMRAAVATRALPPPFGTGGSVPTSYQLMQSVTGALGAAAARQPLALLLDDVHWAGHEALEVLDLLTRPSMAAPLLVIATYRGEGVAQGQPLHDFLPQLRRNRSAAEVWLAALDVSETRRLIEARHGPSSEEFATYLHARADGNPFFVVELLDELIEHHQAPRDAHGRWLPPTGGVPVPAAVRHPIEQRLARLGDEATGLLGAAAVVGVEWELATVEAVLAWPEERLLAALEEALASHLIQGLDDPTERYAFSHGLYRDVVLDRQAMRRRRHLHARVAAALEGSGSSLTPDPARLAHHFGAAENWPRTAHHALVAGDAARARLAAHSAARLYQLALDAARKTAASDRPATLAAIHERLGQTWLLLSHHGTAATAFSRMLADARTAGDRLAEGRALCWLSLLARREYRLAEASATANAALVIAEALDDDALLALAEWNLGHLGKIAGDLDAAERHLTRAVPSARRADAAEVLGWCLQSLAQLATWRGDYATAEQQAHEALDLARAGRDPLSFGGASWVLGIAQGERGRYAAARCSVQGGLDLAGESGERHYQTRLLNTMGWLHAEVGDFAGALPWDDQASRLARHGDGDAVTEAERYALLNLVTDHLGLGDLDAAGTHLRAFERLLDDSEYTRPRYHNRYLLLQAEMALATGDYQTALHLATEAARLASLNAFRKNSLKGRLLAGRAMLALDRPAAAIERLRPAVALADEIDHGALRWQARLWLAAALARDRRTEEATALRTVARGLVETIAAGLPDDRSRTIFRDWHLVRRLHVAPSPSSPRALPAGLSTREVEVLRLVAAGETNQAIGMALNISVKTVNAHVTNILNKTGAANRAAAASFAQRHGLL